MPYLDENPPVGDDAALDEIFGWNQRAEQHIAQLGTVIQGNPVLIQIMIEALRTCLAIPDDEWNRAQQIARMKLLAKMMPQAEQASLQARLQIAR